MLKIGSGHNPYVGGEGAAALRLPSCVDLLELGIEAFSGSVGQADIDRKISLHVSRSPITEDFNSRSRFVRHLQKVAKHLSLVSLGLHLTGPRASGIGKYGFSSHYRSSISNEDAAISFIEQIRDVLGIPVWLENANFYSESSNEIIESWSSFRRICVASGAGAIIDISHAIIDAHNLGLPVESALAMAPWESAVEVHLSGIAIGADGVMHDGHSLRVHDETWRMLRVAIDHFIPQSRDVYITIEHTDADWRGRQNEFSADFERLQKIISEGSSCLNRRRLSPENYARSYLKKILKRRIPLLARACQQRGLSFDLIFDDWLIRRVKRDGIMLCFGISEVPDEERGYFKVAAEDFLDFAKVRLSERSGR